MLDPLEQKAEWWSMDWRKEEMEDGCVIITTLQPCEMSSGNLPRGITHLINDWVVDAKIFDERVANTANSSRGRKRLKTAFCREHSCKNSKRHLAEY